MALLQYDDQPRRVLHPPSAPEQLTRPPVLLSRGAAAYGFIGDVWTRARIAEVIKTEFGVAYHPDHVGRRL